MKDGNKYTGMERFTREDKLMRLREVSSSMGGVFYLLHAKYDMSLDEIVDVLRESGYWMCWEYMDTYDLVGRGAGEIAVRLAEYAGKPARRVNMAFDQSYWIGWFLTHAMYRGRLRFEEIFDALDIREIANMYNVYHEMSVTTGIEDLRKRIQESKTQAER